MALDRVEQPRDLELTSLVDIVFLLLIFFLVSFAFSLIGDVSDSQVSSELELPKTETHLPIILDDKLENLMVQIMPDTSSGTMLRKAIVLWPSFEDTVHISRREAFHRALADSTFAVFPRDFLNMEAVRFETLPPCTLISNSIRRYVAKDQIYRSSGHPLVEVRAEKNTEFRILSFVLEQCSAYQDAIPQIVLRTTP